MLRADSGSIIPLGKVIVAEEVFWRFSPSELMDILFRYMCGPFYMEGSDQSVFPFWMNGFSVTAVFEFGCWQKLIISTEAGRLRTTVTLGKTESTILDGEDLVPF
jgi:hypothetical protein